MQIPPIDVTRWALHALKLLEDAKRTLLPPPPQPPQPPQTPSGSDADRRTPPEIW